MKTNIKHLEQINECHDFTVEMGEKAIDAVFDTIKDGVKIALYVRVVLPIYAGALIVDTIGTKIDKFINKAFTEEEIDETSRRMI